MKVKENKNTCEVKGRGLLGEGCTRGRSLWGSRVQGIFEVIFEGF